MFIYLKNKLDLASQSASSLSALCLVPWSLCSSQWHQSRICYWLWFVRKWRSKDWAASINSRRFQYFSEAAKVELCIFDLLIKKLYLPFRLRNISIRIIIVGGFFALNYMQKIKFSAVLIIYNTVFKYPVALIYQFFHTIIYFSH